MEVSKTSASGIERLSMLAVDAISEADRQRLAELLALRRQLRARDSLIDYARSTFPAYRPATHLRRIAGELEALERGDIDRLIITAPPRHGKSLIVSQRFIAWYFGRRPADEVIHGSYGGRLVRTFGRRLRNLFDHSAHRAIFGHVSLAADSKAADLWHTSAGGVYCAAGVGGAITGFGADLAVIDDPVKSREEADSEVMRDRAWDWWTNDLYTRLYPHSRVVVVATRWHEDDLTGRLLAEGDEWTHLHLKALDDDGLALWPDQFSAEHLARVREHVGPRAWQCLYQGDPAPDEGTYFSRGDIILDQPPPRGEMAVYGASDYATKAGSGDWTVHMVVGIDQYRRMWVLDMWRKRTESDAWVASFVELAKKWEPLIWAEEKGQILSSVGPFLDREMREAGVWVHRRGYSSVADKPTRSRSIQAWVATSGLYLPAAAPWGSALIKEMMEFPHGVHDDQVDCLGLIGRLMRWLGEGSPPKPDKDPMDPWREAGLYVEPGGVG